MGLYTEVTFAERNERHIFFTALINSYLDKFTFYRLYGNTISDTAVSKPPKKRCIIAALYHPAYPEGCALPHVRARQVVKHRRKNTVSTNLICTPQCSACPPHPRKLKKRSKSFGPCILHIDTYNGPLKQNRRTKSKPLEDID